MTGKRRFWFPFWDAARRSLWAKLGGIGLAVYSLVGGTVFWVVGLPLWALFVVIGIAIPLVLVGVYHVAALAWTAEADTLTKLQEELQALREQRPRVELGKPQLEPNGILRRTQLSTPPQTSTGPAGPQYRVEAELRRITNYQIPVTNYGAPAQQVQVSIVGISPGVDNVSKEVTLHIVNDDPPLENYTFKESFSLAGGQTRWVDVVAMDQRDPKTCYLWNIAYEDAVQKVRLGGTHIFTIRAYVGEAPVEARYEVRADSGEARLDMRPLPPS